MTDHKRNEDIREELGITDISNRKKYQKKLLEHWNRTPGKRIPKLLYRYNLKDRCHRRPALMELLQFL